MIDKRIRGITEDKRLFCPTLCAFVWNVLAKVTSGRDHE